MTRPYFCSRVHQDSDEASKPNPLDTTRIHPESYTLATKVALDAMDVGETVRNEDDNDDIAAQTVRELMAEPGERLDALDEGLVAFASKLTELGYSDKLQTLRDICDEMRHPVV